MMKESDNLYAESMYYQIAASTGNKWASAKSARNVERQLIRKIDSIRQDINWLTARDFRSIIISVPNWR